MSKPVGAAFVEVQDFDRGTVVKSMNLKKGEQSKGQSKSSKTSKNREYEQDAEL